MTAALLTLLLLGPPSKPAALEMAWGDQGDGTFVNPIVPGDWSDFDAIRVGDDYYAISSTLHLSPGMAILHSKDLVNWRLLGHAVPVAKAWPRRLPRPPSRRAGAAPG